MKVTLVVAAALSATLSLTLFAQPRYIPPRLASGAPPGLAPMAVGGGQAILEVSIDANGIVTDVKTLRSTPPFTRMLLDSVSTWSFTPATDHPIGRDDLPDNLQKVPSKVLVAALYRAPVLQGPTQGERPTEVAPPSADVPFPSVMTEPVFPPNAHAGGVVMIEARLNPAGSVTVARVIRSSPPLDKPALDAVRRWRFRAPRIGSTKESIAYLIFGFPQPVITTKQ